MVRRFAIVIALLFAVDLWAGEPWKEKLYKDWNEKDVRKILNESPWSKRIEVERNERTHAGLESPEDTSTASEAAGESGEEEAGRGTEQEEKETKKNGINFVIRWGSSRTMREAWVRGQVLQKRISEVDTEKSLPPAPGDYELLLVGPDMTLFEKTDEATLKEKSYLLAKKSKQGINPSKVEFARTSDGKRIKGIIFHFPKRTPGGEPIFAADEKELKFLAPVGAVEIKASFDLQKMVDKAGTDL
ncbi:MAG TPA: hypothetical protein VN948_17050 [Terriglobales bacterium]|nr:hypothetical protein [Terriglobales bacterium]